MRGGAEPRDCVCTPSACRDREADRLHGAVLLDLKLPKVDGIELRRRIRAHPDRLLLPLVALISLRNAQAAVYAYGVGANRHQQESVNSEQFVSAVQQYSMYWLLLNELPDGANH
jgi:CheY-like chemotaxis protein